MDGRAKGAETCRHPKDVVGLRATDQDDLSAGRSLDETALGLENKDGIGVSLRVEGDIPRSEIDITALKIKTGIKGETAQIGIRRQSGATRSSHGVGISGAQVQFGRVRQAIVDIPNSTAGEDDPSAHRTQGIQTQVAADRGSSRIGDRRVSQYPVTSSGPKIHHRLTRLRRRGVGGGSRFSWS